MTLPAMVHDIVLVDHYDSFTRNVLDWLDPGDGRVRVRLIAFDDAPAMAAAESAQVLVFSPGPKRPEDAPASLALLKKRLGRAPILGICLGHQLLAAHAGAHVVRAAAPFHGSTRRINLKTPASRLWAGFPAAFEAAVYNSLTVRPVSLPPPWSVDAESDDGEIQAIAWEVSGRAPAYGVQFHPESYLSAEAPRLRANWLAILAAYASATAPLSEPS